MTFSVDVLNVDYSTWLRAFLVVALSAGLWSVSRNRRYKGVSSLSQLRGPPSLSWLKGEQLQDLSRERRWKLTTARTPFKILQPDRWMGVSPNARDLYVTIYPIQETVFLRTLSFPWADGSAVQVKGFLQVSIEHCCCR